jgi:hypothetical protein
MDVFIRPKDIKKLQYQRFLIPCYREVAFPHKIKKPANPISIERCIFVRYKLPLKKKPLELRQYLFSSFGQFFYIIRISFLVFIITIYEMQKNVMDFIKFMYFEKLENMLYSFHKRCQQVIRIIIVMCKKL